MAAEMTDDKLRSAFDRIDVDGGGTLDRDELTQALVLMGKSDGEIGAILADMERKDASEGDGDGELDFDEFKSLVGDAELEFELQQLKVFGHVDEDDVDGAWSDPRFEPLSDADAAAADGGAVLDAAAAVDSLDAEAAGKAADGLAAGVSARRTTARAATIVGLDANHDYCFRVRYIVMALYSYGPI